MDNLFYLVPAMGVIGLLYTFIKYAWVSKQDPGNERMQEISTYIAEGAMAFLKAEWRILSYFVAIVAVLLFVMGSANANSHWSIGIVVKRRGAGIIDRAPILIKPFTYLFHPGYRFFR